MLSAAPDRLSSVSKSVCSAFVFCCVCVCGVVCFVIECFLLRGKTWGRLWIKLLHLPLGVSHCRSVAFCRSSSKNIKDRQHSHRGNKHTAPGTSFSFHLELQFGIGESDSDWRDRRSFCLWSAQDASESSSLGLG